MKKFLSFLLNTFIFIVEKVLGFFLIIIFLGIMLLGTGALIYDIFSKKMYAYILPVCILIPTLFYLTGLSMIYFQSIIRKNGNNEFLFTPKKLKNRINITLLSITLCKTIFFMASLQLIIALIIGNSLEATAPLLAVAIMICFAAGVPWITLSLIHLADQRAYKNKQQYSSFDKLPSIFENLIIISECMIYPYKSIFYKNKKIK